MRVYDNGAFFSVSVSPSELQAFADRWPCSGMRGATRGMWFQFSKRNGDLVDIKGERKGYDGVAVSALSQDAQAYGEKQFRCTNCSGPLPVNHGTTSKDGKHKFSDACAAISEALNIGNPATRAVFLWPTNGQGRTFMQKRHFEAIAATLRDLKPDRGNRYAPRTVKTKGEAAYGQWLATVNAFASMLGSTNPRFDAARFRTACAYEVE